MDCILCKVFSGSYNQPDELQGMAPQAIPEPVASRYQAPGNRVPVANVAVARDRPQTPGAAIRRNERSVTRDDDGNATDLVNPFPRAAAEGWRQRWTPLKYVQVGGPAMTAPNQPGWSSIDDPNTPGGRLLANHNQSFTIADTMTKPAQQLPRYNYASVDTDSIVERAKNTVMRALYGGGK